jgi:hypothetical protein
LRETVDFEDLLVGVEGFLAVAVEDLVEGWCIAEENIAGVEGRGCATGESVVVFACVDCGDVGGAESMSVVAVADMGLPRYSHRRRC